MEWVSIVIEAMHEQKEHSNTIFTASADINELNEKGKNDGNPKKTQYQPMTTSH